jgi:cell division protein FtsA
MSRQNSNILVALDTGSSKIRVLVAEVVENALRYRGHAIVPAEGMRRGLISDLAPATHAINQAADAAEQSSQETIENLVVGVGGPQVRGINSNSGIAFGSRMREITLDDTRNVTDRARSISLPADRVILHLLPKQYILDNQPGIFDPVGMIGNRLEIDLHMVAGSSSLVQSINTCVNHAGMVVKNTIFEALAAAESTLWADERERGVCLLDIGAGSTEIIVFFEGAVQHTGVVPIGGDHFTNDLAVGLHVTTPEAEWIKCEYGHAVVTAVPLANELELTGMPGHEPRIVRQRLLSEILEPRARELFHMVRENLRRGAVLEALGSGCVLTGGGARLGGMLDTAESLLRVPARIATPVPLSRMPAELAVPECSALVGMLLYTHRIRQSRAAEDHSLRAKLRAIFAGIVKPGSELSP